jgi:hypothetical protein
MEQDLPGYYTSAPGDTGLGDISSLLQDGPAYDPSQITPSYEFGSGPVVYATENPAATEELNRSFAELWELLHGLSINPDAFLERLYITGGLKTSIESAGLDTVLVVTNLLNLILALENKVNKLKLSDEYSYVNKYIICGPQGQYGLDIRESGHYNNTLEALKRVAALHDEGGDSDKLLRSAFLVVEENFSIGSGMDELQASLIEACRVKGAEFLQGVGNIYEKTRQFTIGKVANVVNKLSSPDPHVASEATRQIITHSLKITSYLYGIIEGTLFIADNLTMLLSQVLSYGVATVTYLMSITQVGFGLYTFFMDVLVLSPSPTAYSVLFCIFLIKKYKLGGDFYDNLLARLSVEGNKYIDDFKRRKDDILAHRESAVTLMGEFNEFSEYVLSILGGPVALSVKMFKDLRYRGVEARLEDFHGLGVAKRNELKEMLVSGEGNDLAPELTAEDIQELEDLEDITWEPTSGPRVPDIVISERNSKGRFIFTENVSSQPLQQYFAVKQPPVAIGTGPMSQFAFGKSKKKKKKKKNAKGRNTRRRRRRR